jgi:protein tyrosine phosphatase (PTP) superfamily phosphohydrolase (DUF442 family)
MSYIAINLSGPAMSFPPTPVACSLPVLNNVCFNMGRWIVTAQPNPGAANYTAIAESGVTSILCVRDPSESSATTNPFDVNEAMDTVTTGMSWTNVPLAHFTNLSTPQAQPFFNLQATKAARVIDQATRQMGWTVPILIHCSSGDRASAAFACYMIDYHAVSNAEAVAFATSKLALAAFAPFVASYPKSTP